MDAALNDGLEMGHCPPDIQMTDVHRSEPKAQDVGFTNIANDTPRNQGL